MSKRSRENPFRIDFAYNPQMKAYDVVMQVGGLKDEAQAKAFGEILAQWMTEDGGWKSRMQ